MRPRSALFSTFFAFLASFAFLRSTLKLNLNANNTQKNCTNIQIFNGTCSYFQTNTQIITFCCLISFFFFYIGALPLMLSSAFIPCCDDSGQCIFIEEVISPLSARISLFYSPTPPGLIHHHGVWATRPPDTR